MPEENKSKKAPPKTILFSKAHTDRNPVHAKWLNQAIRSNRWGKDKTVTITYRKEDGSTSERKVKPLQAKNHLLLAHDHSRDAIRSFHIDRIQKMEKSASFTNKAFFEGFEKKAESKEEEKQQMLYDAAKSTAALASIPGVAIGGGIVERFSGAAYDAATGQDSMGDIVKLLKHHKDKYKDLPKKISINKNIHNSYYSPSDHSVVSYKNVGTLSHELGHATGPLGGKNETALKGLYKTVRGVSNHPFLRKFAPVVSPVLAANTENESLQNAAVAAPLVFALPTLAEEAQATVRGINNIRQSLGTRKALKSAPGLMAAFGTYAAMPVAGSLGAYLAKKYVNEKREERDKKLGGAL